MNKQTYEDTNEKHRGWGGEWEMQCVSTRTVGMAIELGQSFLKKSASDARAFVCA